mgnify:FL=1
MGARSKNLNEAKIHHIAFINAKELIKDGYKLIDFGFNEKLAESRYNLIHENNGNKITIVSTECDNMVRVYKNNKLANTISL